MKTSDEIKKTLRLCQLEHKVVWECTTCPYLQAVPCNDALHKDALALIQQLEEDKARLDCTITQLSSTIKHLRDVESRIPRWISVEERLPEPGVRVLVAIGAVFEAYIDDNGKWQRYYSSPLDEVLGRPTHWMKMPEAPKEDAHD